MSSPTWYNNKLSVTLLIIFFFPVGLYGLWRSEVISKKWKYSITTIFVFYLLFLFGVGPFLPQEEYKPVQPTETKIEIVQSAPEELNEMMELAKAADLVISYEFSEEAAVVYVGNTWYTQTVKFKKNFMAKVWTLKKTITGYGHFEIRDAYSDEKVGEVTPFGGLRVYQ